MYLGCSCVTRGYVAGLQNIAPDFYQYHHYGLLAESIC